MSQLFDRINTYVEQRLDLNPIEASHLGVPGRDDRMTDYSLEGAAQRVALDRQFLADLEAMEPETEQDRVAWMFMRERIRGRIEHYEAGDYLRELSTLWSSLIEVRDTFPLMPVATDADWSTLATRLELVPGAVSQQLATLQTGIDQGVVAAQRQARGVARTCLITAGRQGEGSNPASPWFSDFVATYDGTDESLRARLAAAGAAADTAYSEAGQWLLDVYVPAADPEDAVGFERYARGARYFTGATLDLHETYAWGWEELARIHERVDRVVEKIVPGGTLADAVAALNDDPAYTIDGEAALVEYLQGIIDDSIAELSGTYFDIPEAMRRCEACIAPPGGPAAQYYTGPSEDFSRPGRTWWPTQGKSRFHVWSALSTWYHEGVPGHHQQVAYALLQRDRLSRGQRIEFISGHGEGWALYAERLMDELGKFDKPGFELGFLQGQCLRASRVIVDIGMHLKLQLPENPMAVLRSGDKSGQVWHRDLAVEFLIDRGLLEPDFAASEADRYLGLPGQAISYKVGERVWLQARESARARHGESFSLLDWHTKALALGPLGLDPLLELASAL